MIELSLQIPQGFLEEEVRSDYLVTRQMKEVWAVELDLLMKFDQVCRKHNLSYCVGGGTLLGTIRHKGFIPWDDDVDVYLLREDYDKLMELSREFESPYFLTNIKTEQTRIIWHARLRNRNTTCTNMGENYPGVCRGIFIDIFPLDGVSPDLKTNRRQCRKNYIMKRLCSCYNVSQDHITCKNKWKAVERFMQSLLGIAFFHNPNKLQKAYDDNLKKFSVEGTEMWGNRTLAFNCPKSRRQYAEWKDLIYFPFEFIEVPVPRAFDSMLRQQFGNYMEFPKNKDTGHGFIISTDYAYDDPRRT